MPRRTKEEAEQTRKHLLDVALCEFHEKGFAHATLNEIAARAGFTRGAVYWHFKNKTDLFLALADDIDNTCGVDFQTLMSQRAESLDDIRDLAQGYMALFEESARFRRFHELVYYRIEWTDELKPVRKKYLRDARRAIASLAKDFEALQKARRMRADVDPQKTAMAAWAMISGLTGSWLFDPRSFSIKNDGGGMLDMLFNGLKA